ncbi:MAG: 50S ribosomal protein L24 [Prolixibacteraceae bacterium]|jgi:large subunit ribosomal protein L24|nr:50S ribosomal protein L24 [Prolixibacteraceae bacterium]
MQKKFKIKKGDTVKVIAGSEKGATGKVLEVNRKTDRVIVEGANLISKHVKPNAENPQGGIIKQEAGIHISNLMIVDASTKEVTRVGRRLNEDGKLVRYSKKSKEEIK